MSAGSRRGVDAAGLAFAFGAYGLWGLFPPFFTSLDPAGAAEITAHRIVWTFVFLLGVLAAFGRLGELRALRGSTWLLLACASGLISANWFIYVYAVNADHAVDAAFGYFINPLVSVLLGVVVFGERLNRAQSVALLIALAAVLVLAAEVSGPPLIALGLAVSFALYGAVKKVVPADPQVSVGVEAAFAAPVAAAYLIALQVGGHAHFAGHGAGQVALLMLCGPVTAVPLLLFAAAARRLPLVTLGVMQYLTPSMLMAWGVFVGREPMSATRWTGFALIWTALAVFSTDALSRARRGAKGTLLAS